MLNKRNDGFHMITSSKHAGERNGGCRRCRIIRLYIIATVSIVILGLIGGDNLRFLSLVTPEGVALTICGVGALFFIVKLSVWLFQKSKSTANDPEQV